MMKFMLDQNYEVAVQTGLKALGYDVIRPFDVGLSAASDDVILDFAKAENRVLLTHDQDFLRMHAQRMSHTGIVFSKQNHYKVGEIIQFLLLMDACYSADEMKNRLEYL